MNELQHATASSDQFAAEFAASHFKVLRKLRQRVLDAAAKPDISLSEVDKAVSIEIKIANYLHKVKEREEKALKAKQPIQPPQPAAIKEPGPIAPQTFGGPSASCQLRV